MWPLFPLTPRVAASGLPTDTEGRDRYELESVSETDKMPPKASEGRGATPRGGSWAVARGSSVHLEGGRLREKEEEEVEVR